MRDDRPWIEEPSALELGDAPIGSTLCLGPRPGPDPHAPGFGERTPQAFLAQLAPAYQLDVHFHSVDQFQWFVRGGGRFGPHDVGAGAVHYADRYTPYGPLRTADAGASFYTMRAVSDTGAHYMPGARDTLRDGLRSEAIDPARRRNEAWDLLAVDLDGATWVDLRSDADGLRVAVVELEAGGSPPAEVVAGAGAYLAVLQGTVEHDGRPLEACGFTWLEPGEETPDVVARAASTRLGLLQLPA